MSVLERKVEEKFRDFCIANRIECHKLVLANGSGWPDRTLLYKGHVMFLELKRKGEKPKPLQMYVLDRLVANKFRAGWSDDLEEMIATVTEWINYVDSRQ